ncbi:hypothetical protein EWM64_g1596 [Hericium alpestre]|uniref:Uncharacterized protein n=1 Tax=Hericium alpestre TaxID=135208 RepID=A0A4Z0A7V0_9AGAM|nr:hypothetical protein EWM64_g1596 [Hericium alpestre]
MDERIPGKPIVEIGLPGIFDPSIVVIVVAVLLAPITFLTIVLLSFFLVICIINLVINLFLIIIFLLVINLLQLFYLLSGTSLPSDFVFSGSFLALRVIHRHDDWDRARHYRGIADK